MCIFFRYIIILVNILLPFDAMNVLFLITVFCVFLNDMDILLKYF